MSTTARFEFTTENDPSLNYCLWEYHAPRTTVDKFRSVNLLYHSFELAGSDTKMYDIVDAIRDAIGPFRTVFGVKFVEGKLCWEYYFYDYARREREVGISRVLDAIRPLAPSNIRANENLEYFMFSLDIDNALATGERDLDIVHMYIGNPGSAVSSGIAYALTDTDVQLENFYFFFDAGTQLVEAADKIKCSAWFDSTSMSIDSVLLPELRRCHTICVANKQDHDCVYFSGVDIDQLLFFLDLLDYPESTRQFVRDNYHDLDHLLFDVGIDYRVVDDQVIFLKSGYYGVF